MVMLALATSIDAFAVGLSIAFMKVSILLSLAMIGLVALLLSAMGLFTGARLGEALGKLFPKTNVAFSSTAFYQCSFDEGNIGISLGGGCPHEGMIWS